MKDKEVKLEEIESSHTLGGTVIHTQIRQSHGLRQTIPIGVPMFGDPQYLVYYKQQIKEENTAR